MSMCQRHFPYCQMVPGQTRGILAAPIQNGDISGPIYSFELHCELKLGHGLTCESSVHRDMIHLVQAGYFGLLAADNKSTEFKYKLKSAA
jgi:hypothetical protein